MVAWKGVLCLTYIILVFYVRSPLQDVQYSGSFLHAVNHVEYLHQVDTANWRRITPIVSAQVQKCSELVIHDGEHSVVTGGKKGCAGLSGEREKQQEAHKLGQVVRQAALRKQTGEIGRIGSTRPKAARQIVWS